MRSQLFFRCFVVLAVIILASKLGTALTFSLIVAGQMLLSLIPDHHGLLRMPVKQISWQRLLNMSLLVARLSMMRKF